MSDDETKKQALPYLCAIAYAFDKLSAMGYVTDGYIGTEFKNAGQTVKINLGVEYK
jgi:hypothetical protein